MSEELVLRAIDGSNPLAFLAALGTLRLLTLDTGANIKMGWERLNGFWRPRLQGIHATEDELCDQLTASRWWAPAEEFVTFLGENITVPKGKFQPFVERAGQAASLHDRRAADFAAAFGCEACEEENDRIKRTDFCFVTGSGHQNFLGTIAALQKNVTCRHLLEALFEGWRAEKGFSMRWDPSDAAEYALQWNDPGPRGAWAVRGANRLAAEALPLFPTAPVKGGGLQTTGFKRRKRQDELTWPIWRDCIGFASVRSLVALAELQNTPESQDGGLRREALLPMGVEEVYRAQRVRIGEAPNFKVSFRQARSI